MIRLFAAVPVPAEIAAPLARRQQGLDGARWRTAEQMHITLRFFGEIRESGVRPARTPTTMQKTSVIAINTIG